ncbi:Uncharacterized protein Adt_25337 [Abeliophyllum distichum]|uniref:Uncharacterized protein n=1 Tax=Abeliophyllum distichum TaxID=126358 RepID=A0ABD1SGB5_9LAMI
MSRNNLEEELDVIGLTREGIKTLGPVSQEEEEEYGNNLERLDVIGLIGEGMKTLSPVKKKGPITVTNQKSAPLSLKFATLVPKNKEIYVLEVSGELEKLDVKEIEKWADPMEVSINVGGGLNIYESREK